MISANQETIVELMGFVNRVFPKTHSNRNNSKVTQTSSKPIDPQVFNEHVSTSSNTTEKDTNKDTTNTNVSSIRTEITFDFHRLNVLVLRAVMRDSFLVGRKVGTFTMSEAKIHATLGPSVTVEGSLGGLQIIDLTPEGISHQRILSVGKDPLTEPPNIAAQDLLSSLTQEVYGIRQHKTVFPIEDQQAFSFFVSRDLSASVTIRIRMASVWYTHCARFMQELSWCATEFKHYLK